MKEQRAKRPFYCEGVAMSRHGDILDISLKTKRNRYALDLVNVIDFENPRTLLHKVNFQQKTQTTITAGLEVQFSGTHHELWNREITSTYFSNLDSYRILSKAM